jgi:hypothetical protein
MSEDDVKPIISDEVLQAAHRLFCVVRDEYAEAHPFAGADKAEMVGLYAIFDTLPRNPLAAQH